jgi:hypothetical protein
VGVAGAILRNNFITIPLTPTLISPANGQTSLGPQNLFLDWTSVANVTSYRVIIYNDSLFSSIYKNTTVLVDSMRINFPSIVHSYWWKVVGLNISGRGSYSPVWKFTINPTRVNPVSSVIPKVFRLYENFPNPYNPTTKIRFDIPKNSLVKILVYDMAGREIQQLVKKELTAGADEYIFNGNNYASGIYFYRMQSADYLSVKKMVLIK